MRMRGSTRVKGVGGAKYFASFGISASGNGDWDIWHSVEWVGMHSIGGFCITDTSAWRLIFLMKKSTFICSGMYFYLLSLQSLFFHSAHIPCPTRQSLQTFSLKLLHLMSSYDAGGDTLKSKNGNTSSAVFPFYNKPLMPLYPLYLGQVIRRGEFKPSSGKKHEE
jgi:hypothetical protein